MNALNEVKIERSEKKIPDVSPPSTLQSKTGTRPKARSNHQAPVVTKGFKKMFMMSPPKVTGKEKTQPLKLDIDDMESTTGQMTARLKHIASLNRRGLSSSRNAEASKH